MSKQKRSMWDGFHVEMPNCDAHRVIQDMDKVKEFLATYGINEDEFVVDGRMVEVPAFAESRQKYSDMKAANCAVWGCE